MRIHEISGARQWRKMEGHRRPCFIRCGSRVAETTASFGLIETGKQRVFQGYFVKIAKGDGEEWLGTDSHSIRRALLAASEQARHSGWEILAIGIDKNWRETGLSWNSGFGYHPDFEEAAHMLDLPQRT